MGISTTWEGGEGGPMLLAFGSFVTKLIPGNPLLSIRKMPISLHSDARIVFKKIQVILKFFFF